MRLNGMGCIHECWGGGQQPQLLWETPVNWMKVKVTPVFKKGKEEDLGNYRPISLTLPWKGGGTNPPENHF